jgi:hypothetical protein
MIIRSIQAFINGQAETNPLLAQDLTLLYGPQLLNTGRPTLLVNGMGDSRTVAALAVYQWRMSHPTAAVGEWARGLGITLPRIVPLTPAPGPRPPGQDAGSEPQDQQRRPPAVPY